MIVGLKSKVSVCEKNVGAFLCCGKGAVNKLLKSSIVFFVIPAIKSLHHLFFSNKSHIAITKSRDKGFNFLKKDLLQDLFH